MKNRFTLISILLLIAVLATTIWYWVIRPGPHISGPIRNEVYVWQRAWTQPVREAVTEHGTNFSGMVPLKAEISWKDKKPQLTRVAIDYATLAKAGSPVGLALRI